MRIFSLAPCALLLTIPLVSVANGWQEHQQHQHSTQSTTDTNPFNEEQVEYVCPMHSQIVKAQPGSCPICGMDLVERAVEPSPSSNFPVSAQQQQALRVTTARVERKTITPTLSAQAQVNWQQSAKFHVHSRAEGWIEQLYTDVEGQWVNKGDKLYRVYAPDLVVAQDDYLQLLDSLDEVGGQHRQQQFKRRGQQRLRLLGMNAEQIAELESSRQTRYEVDYFAQQSGYVTELNIQQGMYVNPGLELMTISGDQQLWFLLDIPVRFADRVAVGQMAHIGADDLDGHWMGKIDYIYPQVDAETQTLTARVPVNASIDQLREGLWATARVELPSIKNALTIPLQSLLQTGRNQRVIVQTEAQQFAVREVTSGLRVGEEVIITAGLSEGEKVVTNGQFLLDSEASLRGLQPNATSDKKATMSMSHEHGGH